MGTNVDWYYYNVFLWIIECFFFKNIMDLMCFCYSFARAPQCNESPWPQLSKAVWFEVSTNTIVQSRTMLTATNALQHFCWRPITLHTLPYLTPIIGHGRSNNELMSWIRSVGLARQPNYGVLCLQHTHKKNAHSGWGPNIMLGLI